MSDALAVAAVTDTLISLLQSEVDGGVQVVAKPPSEVLTTGHPQQVNLFLYQADVDGALRNEDRIDLAPGESGDPPLPLVLHYLLTPYVRDGTESDAHRLLGHAVRALHEHTSLGRVELAEFAPAYSDVVRQLDRIRITWQPFGEKDIYSLWSAFQTPYRMSVAFEVRPVLIDSRRRPRTATPVLRRGRRDEGPLAQGNLESPFPELTSAVPVRPDGQGVEHADVAAPLGGRVVLRGANLAAKKVDVRLTHRRLTEPVLISDLAQADVTATEVRFVLDDSPAGTFPAGLWSVALVLTDEVVAEEGGTPENVVTVTNEVPLAVAPTITNLPVTVPREGSDDSVAVVLTYAPFALPGQPVLLLLGSRSAEPATPRPADPPLPPDGMRFRLAGVQPGRHLLRLRVDGVDSLLVDRSKDKPEFDENQIVTVT
jgi:hypothetical protein